jgi:phosphoglycolate phosphatase
LTGQDSPQNAARFTRRFHLRADLVMDGLTVIYEYVPPMLAVLRSCNIRVGVVSTKLHYRIRNILQRNNLADFFEVIVGADDVAKSKPDSEGLLLALKTLGVTSSSALYVGDHVVDAEAAQAAGVFFVAVLSGRHQRNQFDQVPHLAILENVQQIPAFLRLHEKKEASSSIPSELESYEKRLD